MQKQRHWENARNLEEQTQCCPQRQQNWHSLAQGHQARLAPAGAFQGQGAVSLFNRHRGVPRTQAAVSKSLQHPEPAPLGFCQGLRSPGALKSCTLELFLWGSSSGSLGSGQLHQAQNLSGNSWHQPLCHSISGKRYFFI